jgi:hypothetical protein
VKISSIVIGVVLLAGPALAQTPEVIAPTATGVSPALSSLGDLGVAEVSTPYFRPAEEGVDRATLQAIGGGTISAALVTPSSTPTFQNSLGTLGVDVTKNFAGLGIGFNASWVNQQLIPPDTTMAVGPTQVVQWVNVKLTIMDKNGVPLLGGAGFINGNAIWNGLPATSVCRTTNQGDPIVQYDRLADRWVLSQFAFTVATATSTPFRTYPAVGSYRQCIAVSTTGDATGTYNLYEYPYAAFPDYGKLGVWPDGGAGSYVVTYNDFTFSTTTGLSAFAGARVCAYNRQAMIAGASAAEICMALGQSRFALIPSDLDGPTQAPSGSPNYVVSGDWFFLNNPPYALRLQKFKPNFAVPANSTYDDGLGGGFNSFILMPLSSVAPHVVGSCGDGGGACVPQPATVRVLDTLSMRPMYRLAYRNRGAGQESLVFTHSVDPPAASVVAGMNWIELKNPNANPPVIFQNGVLNPNDGVNRWMGSGAMDKVGNIGIGYSVSGSTLSPGIRIAGRYRTDLKGQMRGELNVQTGGGSQTTTAQRWGDYSTMQIDPADDCTFWYTQEYMAATSRSGWSTRVVAFKFPNCQ